MPVVAPRKRTVDGHVRRPRHQCTRQLVERAVGDAGHHRLSLFSSQKMSWNAYTDSLISTGKISKAAIYSAAGDSLWAQSGGYNIAPQEISNIAAGYADPSNLQAHGLHVEGKKFFLLKADERSIYGKQEDQGVIAVKTKQAIVIAHYPSGVQAQEATAVVEKLADYLISSGY